MSEDVQRTIEAIEANWPPENYTMLREALTLAIQALKQMKPTEPCEWCDGKDHEIAKAPWTYLHIKGNELSAHGDDTAFVDIKFCPNCGREV